MFVSVQVQVSVGDEGPPASDGLVSSWPPPLHHLTLSDAVGALSVLVEELYGEGGSGRPLQLSIVLSRLGVHRHTDIAIVVWVHYDMDLVALIMGVHVRTGPSLLVSFQFVEVAEGDAHWWGTLARHEL